MKMVKSLLLGSATGLVAIAGAQAADLPVKAKPVQYVKICSLYGVGFYYIPGTDMCIKVGGWVRQQTDWNANGSLTNGPLIDNLQTRATANFDYRTRGYITADARNQTAYGTVRAYIAVGTSTDNAGGGTFSSNRAFIQWAGFTFGLAQSFFDLYSGPAVSYYGGKIVPASDTGDGGAEVWAYTAQFGNGFSGTISAEGPRTMGVWNTNNGAFATTGLAFAASNEGQMWPDFVANLRVDQAWGSAQIMGAIHNASGQYYTASTNTTFGHPSDAVGWAIGGGLKLNTPMIGKGDYFQTQVNYTEGALGFMNAGANAHYDVFQGGTAGGKYATGMMLDSVYGVLGGVGQAVQLTTGFGVNASYEHFWNAQWRTSLYGVYEDVKYDTTANTMMCANELAAGIVPVAGNTTACGNNWHMWSVGSRTQWNVTPDFYMGVDVVYTELDTASKGMLATVPGSGTQPTATRTFSDIGETVVQFRIHKDFYP